MPFPKGGIAWNRGKPWSKEVIENIRKAKIGKKIRISPDRLLQLRNQVKELNTNPEIISKRIASVRRSARANPNFSWGGKKRPKEFGKRMSEVHKGKTVSLETREKIRKFRIGKFKGKDNPN